MAKESTGDFIFCERLNMWMKNKNSYRLVWNYETKGQFQSD